MRDTREQLAEAARHFLARHYRVMATAINVADWPSYIRLCASAQEDGAAWFDDRALDEMLLPVVERHAAEKSAEALRDFAYVLEAMGLGDKVKSRLLAACDALGIDVAAAPASREGAGQ